MDSEILDVVEEDVDCSVINADNPIETNENNGLDVACGSVPSDCADSLDELADEEENTKFVRGSRKLWAFLAFINALLICGSIYINFFMWKPKERVLCDDNIFCGNSLSISEKELDKVVDSLEKELGVWIAEEDEDEYALLNAVLENDCLTEEEKKIFYSFIDIIKDNLYLDREAAYRSLRNVEISYKCRPYTYDRNVQGVYSYIYESIGIFEKDEDHSILIHEGIHSVFCNEKNVGLPTYFKEGMTELLVNEYFQNAQFFELENYPFEIAAVKMLCEITSPDTVLKAYSCGNMDIIAEEMASVAGNIRVARGALDMLEKVFLKYYGQLDGDNEKLTYEQIVNGFIPVFRGIVTAKYQETDSNRVSYFYNEILLGNIFYDDAYDNYVDDLAEFGSDHKAYFSSKLKYKLAAKEIADKISDDNVGKTYKKEKQV